MNRLEKAEDLLHKAMIEIYVLAGKGNSEEIKNELREYLTGVDLFDVNVNSETNEDITFSYETSKFKEITNEYKNDKTV